MKYFVAVAYLATHFHTSSASENERSWGWGGGGKPTNKPTNTPTKRPTSNTWGSSSWSNNGPTDWVWNGWGWNEAVSHNAWTGDGWNGSWKGKQTSAPTGTPTGFPSKVPSVKPSTSKSPSSLPSTSPSGSSMPSILPSSWPSTTPSSSSMPTTCCNPAALRQTILEKVYNSDDDSIFDGGPAKDAIAWLDDDACNCGEFCSDDQVVQRYILAVFYFSTNGNNWNSCSAPDNIQSDEKCEVWSNYGNNIIDEDDEYDSLSRGFKWLTCNTECKWSGTHCNENGLINVTDVQSNNLTGSLPSEVGALPELSAFVVRRGNVSGSIPSSYSDLTEMTILDLVVNSLSGNLFDLSKMSKLQQLRLSRNGLGGTIEGLGWDMTNLQLLDLAYNEFTGPIPTEIGDLPNLSFATLECNQFDTPLEWANCPSVILYADKYICDESSCDCIGFTECD